MKTAEDSAGAAPVKRKQKLGLKRLFLFSLLEQLLIL